MTNILSDELITRLMEVIKISLRITPNESNTIMFVIGAGIGTLNREAVDK